MKKKLKIDLIAKGHETENLAIIVSRHNEGFNPVSLEDIASYLWVRRSTCDYLKNADLVGRFEDDDKTKLTVLEKTKVVALLEEIELHELNEDDLNGVLFTSENENEETIL